ncbi:MAG TPA: phage portal protein [Ancylobacter sp.]
MPGKGFHQLDRQQCRTDMTGFITTNDGTVSFSGDTSQGVLNASLEPGAMVVLQPGQDVRFSDPPAVSEEANTFAKITLHEIATALGLPYEVLTGDLASVNYSSIRAGLVE